MEWPKIITQYQWSVVDRNKLFKVESYTNPKWYFTFKQCETDALKHIARDDFGDDDVDRMKALSIHIDMRYADVASPDEMSNHLALFMLRREILELMSDQCYGCRTDDPSQITHMEGGCLMEWEDAVDMYFHLSLFRLNENSVTPYIERVCCLLDVSQESLVVDISDPSYAEKLKGPVNTDYDLLFELE
jgi:hypothetical protein